MGGGNKKQLHKERRNEYRKYSDIEKANVQGRCHVNHHSRFLPVSPEPRLMPVKSCIAQPFEKSMKIGVNSHSLFRGFLTKMQARHKIIWAKNNP